MSPMWESSFVVTCVFLGDDPDRAASHLAVAAPPVLRFLRSPSKLDRARAFASEIDQVKQALAAMEEPWR